VTRARAWQSTRITHSSGIIEGQPGGATVDCGPGDLNVSGRPTDGYLEVAAAHQLRGVSSMDRVRGEQVWRWTAQPGLWQ